MKENRPLFSIVISCYNSRKYIGYLLESLCHQGIKKEEYEIIISDDCSTEPYDDIVDKYNRKLNIRWIKAPYNFGKPAHTREQGACIAKGEWLTFSDHDDLFTKNALKKIKKYIKEVDSKYYIKSTVKNGEIGYLDSWKKYDNLKTCRNSGITHGSFYNVDNLWRKYNIHYKENCFSEDVYINNILGSLVLGNLIYMDSTDIVTYIWNYNTESMSKSNMGNIPYLENIIKDFVDTTYGVFKENYELDIIPKSILKESCINNLILLYFYMQYCKQDLIYNSNNRKIEYNERYIANTILKECVESFNYNIEEILTTTKRNRYDQIYKNVSETLFLNDIPITETYQSWLIKLFKYLEEDNDKEVETG